MELRDPTYFVKGEEDGVCIVVEDRENGLLSEDEGIQFQ